MLSRLKPIFRKFYFFIVSNMPTPIVRHPQKPFCVAHLELTLYFSCTETDGCHFGGHG